MFSKPPVVQVWVEVRFEPAGGPEAPSVEAFIDFLEQFAADYPVLDALQQPMVQFEPVRGKGRQRVRAKEYMEVARVRARTEDEGRFITIEPNLLTCNYLRRQEGDYPGFTALCEEALDKCRRYMDRFRPQGVKAAALHYIDLVELPPVTAGQVWRLDDFIRITANLPQEDLGPVGTFDLRLTTLPPGSNRRVHIRCARESSDSDTRAARVRLEWHTLGHDAVTDDLAVVRAGLQDARDRLFTCFRASVTDLTWQMFGPT